MARQSEPVEQDQQDWQSRSAKQRLELSLSIEETLAENDVIDESFPNEGEESISVSKNSIIIPPILSLQSRPLPVVHAELKEASTPVTFTTTDAVEVPQTAQKKRRLAGRTTKVHLQAVPKYEKQLDAKALVEKETNFSNSDDVEQFHRKSNSKRNTSSFKGASAKRKIGDVDHVSLAGTEVLKQGQVEVAVTNKHISPSSVVVVALIADPGPLVVKYITLRPETGFTVHFSAPAETDARFNYVILMGELF